MLGKYHPAKEDLCPLEALTNLYVSEKVEHGVVVVISTMLENLLTTKDYDPNDGDEDQELGPVLVVNEAPKLKFYETERNQGTCI